MSAAQIDTSGVVRGVTVSGFALGSAFTGSADVLWTMLNPFTQGFVDAALRSRIIADGDTEGSCLSYADLGVGFSDLAPETLARFMEDCERHEKRYGVARNDPRQPSRGKNFWINRQVGMWASEGFPPLHLYLADDGKVRITEAGL